MPLGKYFVIRSRMNSSLVLETHSAGGTKSLDTVVRTSLLLGNTQRRDHQLWFYDRSTSTLRNALNSYCLDINDEDELVVRPYQTNNNSQQWNLNEGQIELSDDFEAVCSIKDDQNSVGSHLNVSLNENRESQNWDFIYEEAYFFLIRSQVNNRVFDIKGGKNKAGTKVILFPENKGKTTNQLWYEDTNGIIRSKAEQFALDVEDNGSIVVNHFSEGSISQSWIVRGDQIVNQRIPEQRLSFSSGWIEDSVISSDTSVSNSQNHLWFFDYVVSDREKHAGNGRIFILQSQINELYLALQNTSSEPDTEVVLKELNSEREPSEDFQWYLDQDNRLLKAASNSYTLDIHCEKAVVNQYSGSDSQNWTFIDNKIMNTKDSSSVIQVDDIGQHSLTCGAYDGTRFQQFTLVKLPARRFFLLYMDKEDVLDVTRADQEAGTSVCLYQKKSADFDNQLWYQDENDIIRAHLNGLVLTATETDTKLDEYDPANEDQQWTIINRQIRNVVNSSLILGVRDTLFGRKLVKIKNPTKNDHLWTWQFS